MIKTLILKPAERFVSHGKQFSNLSCKANLSIKSSVHICVCEFHLSLSDDVLQCDEAATNRLLLLLLQLDLDVSNHGEQGYHSLVVLQAFLTH